MTQPEILLIDDDAFASVLRKRVLEVKGYRVQICLDGTSGIALAEALKPALVILDHRLPGMSGPDIVIALRKLLPATRIISLSGQEFIGELYPVPPDAFLTKGDSVPAMLQIVASLLP